MTVIEALRCVLLACPGGRLPETRRPRPTGGEAYVYAISLEILRRNIPSDALILYVINLAHRKSG